MSCRGALICPTILLVWQRPSETCEKQILVSKFRIIFFSKFVSSSVRAVTMIMMSILAKRRPGLNWFYFISFIINFDDLYGKTNDALIFSFIPGRYFDKIYFNFYKFEETAAWSDTHQGPLRIPRTETSHYIFQTKSQNLCRQIQKKFQKLNWIRSMLFSKRILRNAAMIKWLGKIINLKI